jgi:hypothetical protein
VLVGQEVQQQHQLVYWVEILFWLPHLLARLQETLLLLVAVVVARLMRVQALAWQAVQAVVGVVIIILLPLMLRGLEHRAKEIVAAQVQGQP